MRRWLRSGGWRAADLGARRIEWWTRLVVEFGEEYVLSSLRIGDWEDGKRLLV